MHLKTYYFVNNAKFALNTIILVSLEDNYQQQSNADLTVDCGCLS